MRIGRLLLACVALFALQSAVFGAISLIYEEGPDCGTSPALGTEITI
jgi:hypothetical protein